MTFSSCWRSIHHPRLMITAEKSRDAISHISTMFYKFRKTPLAKLDSIIENSIPFPHFHWILVAYGEKSVFYGRAKSCPLHWPRNDPKKCKLVKVWRDSGQKTGIFHNICNCLKNKKATDEEEKTLFLRPFHKILTFESLWGRGRDLRMSDWWTHSDFWLQLSSAHVMIERGGGAPRIERSGQLGWLLCPTPGLTLHCHNYSLLNISQPNSYNSGPPSGEMVITPLCRRMHWPRLLTDDLRDNDPEMAARTVHGPTPHLSILRFWQKHGAESISGLTRPLRVKCWCKIFPTYLTLSSEFYTIIIWSEWSITLLFYEVQYCSKASNVSALEYISDKSC